MSRKSNLEYEFLPVALEIEETPASPLGRILIWIVFLIVLSTIVWSYLGRVDEVAIARGKVIPDGRVKVIQPIEEGSIRAIHVEDGQKVKKGDLLIELDSTIKQADVDGLKKTLSIALLEKQMLIAELAGKEIDPSSISEDLVDLDIYKETLELQKLFKIAREEEYSSKVKALKLEISQMENELQMEQINLTRMEKKSALLLQQEQDKPNDKLLKNETELLDSKMELYTSEQELESQKKKLQSAADKLEVSKANLATLKKEQDKVILGEIMEKEKTITSVEAELVKAQRQFDFQQLISPVNGTIHGLASTTIGGVVTPAQPIVTVVPDGIPLIVEATVLNADIGFIKVGQVAEVKLDTFPFQKYGTILAKVIKISPDAFEDEKLGPIYKIKVQLEKESLIISGQEIHISPGMTVSAEVKTGQRRIIEFFLSPIIKYAKESLNLR